MHFFLEEFHWVVIGPTLHILRQPEESRPAIARVQHCRNGGGQRLNDLRRMRDAIPIAADRFERVIHTKGRVIVVLHLLKNRVRQAGDEGIAAQHQHWQAIGMGQSGGG